MNQSKIGRKVRKSVSNTYLLEKRGISLRAFCWSVANLSLYQLCGSNCMRGLAWCVVQARQQADVQPLLPFHKLSGGQHAPACLSPKALFYRLKGHLQPGAHRVWCHIGEYEYHFQAEMTAHEVALGVAQTWQQADVRTSPTAQVVNVKHLLPVRAIRAPGVANAHRYSLHKVIVESAAVQRGEAGSKRQYGPDQGCVSLVFSQIVSNAGRYQRNLKHLLKVRIEASRQLELDIGKYHLKNALTRILTAAPYQQQYKAENMPVDFHILTNAGAAQKILPLCIFEQMRLHSLQAPVPQLLGQLYILRFAGGSAGTFAGVEVLPCHAL